MEISNDIETKFDVRQPTKELNKTYVNLNESCLPRKSDSSGEKHEKTIRDIFSTMDFDDPKIQRSLKIIRDVRLFKQQRLNGTSRLNMFDRISFANTRKRYQKVLQYELESLFRYLIGDRKHMMESMLESDFQELLSYFRTALKKI